MATTAIKGNGTQVHVDTDGNGAWFKLGMVKKVSKPTASIPELDATDLDSVAEEVIAGLTSFGEMALVLNWLPGNATDLYLETWREGGNENRHTRITTPNGKTYTVDTFIKNYGGDIATGTLMESNLTLRCSGGVTRG